MVIKHTSFVHKGGYYFYRIHQDKVEQLCSQNLKHYLYDVFQNCPHQYFNEGPRSSHLKFNLSHTTTMLKNHEVCSLTLLGLEKNNLRFKTAHSKVQVFMLENDPSTIAVELPVWFTPQEMEKYQSIFQTSAPLTGHIDLVRMENNLTWIWDYKPHADKEKYATTQVYFYALMLAQRTGMNLDQLRCGYFDESVCYMFDPSKVQL